MLRMTLFNRWDQLFKWRLQKRPFGLHEEHSSRRHPDAAHQETDEYVARTTESYVELHTKQLKMPPELLCLKQTFSQTRFCEIKTVGGCSGETLTTPISYSSSEDDEDAPIKSGSRMKIGHVKIQQRIVTE